MNRKIVEYFTLTVVLAALTVLDIMIAILIGFSWLSVFFLVLVVGCIAAGAYSYRCALYTADMLDRVSDLESQELRRLLSLEAIKTHTISSEEYSARRKMHYGGAENKKPLQKKHHSDDESEDNYAHPIKNAEYQ